MLGYLLVYRIAHKIAVVRSIHTDDDSHDVSGYWILTGYPYPGGPGSARQIKPGDWPYLGSVLKMVKPSERLPALTSVWIPDVMRLNDNVTPAGQTAGFLGKQWEPERFVGDPAASDYRIEGVSLPADVSVARFEPYSPEENLLFVNAWNEWGEGNHLEPCQRWGRGYLEAHARVMRRGRGASSIAENAPTAAAV